MDLHHVFKELHHVFKHVSNQDNFIVHRPTCSHVPACKRLQGGVLGNSLEKRGTGEVGMREAIGYCPKAFIPGLV